MELKEFIYKKLRDIEFSLNEATEEDFEEEIEYDDYRKNLFGMRQAYEEVIKFLNEQK